MEICSKKYAIVYNALFLINDDIGLSLNRVWKKGRTHLITTFYNRHEIYMYYEKYISYPNSSYYIKS